MVDDYLVGIFVAFDAPADAISDVKTCGDFQEGCFVRGTPAYSV
jgi:hypothetical protein